MDQVPLSPWRYCLIQLELDLLERQGQQALALGCLVQIRRRRKRLWVKPWISRRLDFGFYNKLMRELEAEDEAALTNLMRMEPAMYHELLHRLTPRLTKQDTNWRKALEPGIKLAITLRHLANGEAYRSLRYSFRVAHNTISLIIREVCDAIIAEFCGKCS